MTIETLPAQFEGHSLDVIVIGQERWLRGPQIGAALGYWRPEKSIRQIFQRSADEFSVDDTLMVEVPTEGGMQLTRLFSQKGAIKIAMLARTDKAAAFRDWAASVLTAPVKPPATLPNARLSSTAAKELGGFWLKHPANRKFLKYAAMDLSNSEIALLCGWKNGSTVSIKRRAAEALGLLEPPADLAERQQQLRQRFQLAGPAA